MHASSAQSHGFQAAISESEGSLWIRRLPRSSNLKCLTAFVMYLGLVDARLRQSANEQPARGTDKRPARDIFLVTRLLANSRSVPLTVFHPAPPALHCDTSRTPRTIPLRREAGPRRVLWNKRLRGQRFRYRSHVDHLA
jgi:hypothetical protein